MTPREIIFNKNQTKRYCTSKLKANPNFVVVPISNIHHNDELHHSSILPQCGIKRNEPGCHSISSNFQTSLPVISEVMEDYNSEKCVPSVSNGKSKMTTISKRSEPRYQSGSNFSINRHLLNYLPFNILKTNGSDSDTAN